MIKIIAKSSSFRKGATEYVVKEALKEAEEVSGVSTEHQSINGKKINFYLHCDRYLRNKSLCFIEDDISELIELMLEADGFIIGSPVYDMNITAQLVSCFNQMSLSYFVHPGCFRNKK